jgi:cyclic beta-1,2-glucan synthetase
MGWIVLPSPWFWTLAVIGIILIPSLLSSALNLLQKPSDVTLGQHLSAGLRSAKQHFIQAAFMLICLPYEAFYSLDAISRTSYRMMITHKQLLQWNPSDERGSK